MVGIVRGVGAAKGLRVGGKVIPFSRDVKHFTPAKEPGLAPVLGRRYNAVVQHHALSGQSWVTATQGPFSESIGAKR